MGLVFATCGLEIDIQIGIICLKGGEGEAGNLGLFFSAHLEVPRGRGPCLMSLVLMVPSTLLMIRMFVRDT